MTDGNETKVLDMNGEGDAVEAAEGEAKAVEAPRFTAVYYSHNRGPKAVLDLCRENLLECVRAAGGQAVAATWEPVTGFAKNVIMEAPHANHAQVYKQILAGIAEAKAEVIFLCEHDVLYSTGYFEQMLASVQEKAGPLNAMIFYNDNVWHLDWRGFYKARSDVFRFLSNCVAYKASLVPAIEAKLEESIKKGSPLHAEPRGETCPVERVSSDDPTVDIRHGGNFTGPREPELGPIAERLEPFGNSEQYAYLFGRKVAPAVPGMGAKDTLPCILASCCVENRRAPGDRPYTIGKIGAEWFQVGWQAASQKVDGKNTVTTWKCYANPIRYCPVCGTPLNDMTPKRRYHVGDCQLLDAVIHDMTDKTRASGDLHARLKKAVALVQDGKNDEAVALMQGKAGAEPPA